MERISDCGRRSARVEPFTADSSAHVTRLTEVLAEHDEGVLRAFVENEPALSYPRALDRAGTWVCEPLTDLRLEVPASTAPGVLTVLGQLKGRVTGQFSANGLSTIGAVLPVAHVRELQYRLPGLSMGEGIMETRPGGFQPIGDNPPRRLRSTQARSTGTPGWRRWRSAGRVEP
jgi:translation elongation factor EF-G